MAVVRERGRPTRPHHAFFGPRGYQGARRWKATVRASYAALLAMEKTVEVSDHPQEMPMKPVVSVVEYSTYPRGPRSGPGCSVPVRHHLIGPIRPTRGHTAISPHGGLYAMPSLYGSA